MAIPMLTPLGAALLESNMSEDALQLHVLLCSIGAAGAAAAAAAPAAAAAAAAEAAAAATAATTAAAFLILPHLEANLEMATLRSRRLSIRVTCSRLLFKGEEDLRNPSSVWCFLHVAIRSPCSRCVSVAGIIGLDLENGEVQGAGGRFSVSCQFWTSARILVVAVSSTPPVLNRGTVYRLTEVQGGRVG